MIGNRSQLINFVSKFSGTVKFRNDHIAKIMGYGDYQMENFTISQVYYVEGLGHNLFYVGQFYDSDIEVAFRKYTCFIRDLEGVDLLKGSRGSNLYNLSLENLLLSSPTCLLSKASNTKSWLRHQRLSRLNFNYITSLAKHVLVRRLPKLKYQKDHLCSAYALSKSKKHSHKPKAEDSIQEKLYILHMDLYRPMRIQSINGRKYILIIVDDYSRFTWVKFLHSKDEVPEFVIKFLKMIQVRLNETVYNIRTDNGTEFVNQTLEDLGKLKSKANIGIFIGYAPAKKAFRIYNKRTRMIIKIIHVDFDELTTMASEQFIPTVIALELVVSTDTPSSTTIDQDAPSTSTSQTTQETPSPVILLDVEEADHDIEVAHIDNKSSFDNLILEPSSKESSSRVIIPNNVLLLNQPPEYINKWTKDHPIDNVIGDPSGPVSTRLQLQDEALFYVDDGQTIILSWTAKFIKSRGIFLNQSKYALESLKKYGIETCDPVDTPMVEKSKLDEDPQGTVIDPTRYRGMIVILMYLTSSRSDLVFSVCMCARYQAKPTENHLHAVKRIFRYLKGTITMGLWYSKDSCIALIAFTDADDAGCQDTRKSMSGSMLLLGERLVSWSSKKQKSTTISSAEAEYIALSGCCAQILWMRSKLMDYGMYTIKKIQGTDSFEFILANKRCVVDAEVFRKILGICPRVEGEEFTEGMFYKENVDYPELIWEDFAFQIDHKKEKKSKRETMPFLDSPKSSSITSSHNTSLSPTSDFNTIIQSRMMKSKGKGSQGKKIADTHMADVDVFEEFDSELARKKTTSRRVIKKKATISAVDNIIPDPDVALELGKSISLTKATEEEAARQVHATHARIVTESVLESARRRPSGIAIRDNPQVSKKVSFGPSQKLKGVQSLTPEEQEATYTMKALRESKKTSRRQPFTGGLSEGTGRILGVFDESTVISATSSEEHVNDDEDEEMSNAEVEDSGKGDTEIFDVAKADVEKTEEVKDDAKKAELPLTSSSLSVSLGFGDQFLKLSYDTSLIGTVKDSTDAKINSLLDIKIQFEVPHIHFDNDENAMDKEVADTVKNYKREHDDDDDDPLAGPNHGKDYAQNVKNQSKTGQYRTQDLKSILKAGSTGIFLKQSSNEA
nr:uncharacterized mitochondrial protein AtMg00810-like [Tanacetum cinerariifolium]